MNFLSCVCVDIMGPKFKLIFVWPNLVMQAKAHCIWTWRRNKVIPFPQWKHIFPCLKSLATLFRSVCEGPIHYLPLFLGETVAHMASCVACVFTCLSVLVWASYRQRRAYWHTYSMSLCTCVRGSEGGWDGCVHTRICLCRLSPVLFSVLLSGGHGPAQELWSFPVTG